MPCYNIHIHCAWTVNICFLFQSSTWLKCMLYVCLSVICLVGFLPTARSGIPTSSLINGRKDISHQTRLIREKESPYDKHTSSIIL